MPPEEISMALRHLVITLLATSVTAAVAPQAAAQVMGDASCPKFAVDHASFATCDHDRVARMGEVTPIPPRTAYELKQKLGPAVVFLDVRSRIEAAMLGTAVGIDHVIPYLDVAQPMRWDSARGALAREANPDFLAQIATAVSSQAAGFDTPIVLLCSNGAHASLAAEDLRRVGYAHIYVVVGGLDGSASAPGWRATGLPTEASANEQQLFGPGG
ncbi:MAG TPA: rhodanese-like domain-containing protein [Burkholderiaceae bacterium]|nr:rhodanese-like domain-containing protein [Burkholderiaceae bacterium]